MCLLIFLLLDVEKRDNPVCHFVTPLDGTVDSDMHRPAEVSVHLQCKCWHHHLDNSSRPLPVASAGYRESMLEDQDSNSHKRIPQVENILQEKGVLFK